MRVLKNKHFRILLILAAGALILFFPYILHCRPFWFNQDQEMQYYAFYTEWNRLIDAFLKNGSFPYYSFNAYLGNNFFAAKVYYCVGDVFIWFVRFFPNLKDGLLAETVLITILSGYFFSVLLRIFGIRNERVIISVSFVYMLSGAACLFIGQYMFQRFYCFLPLLFASIEYARKYHKYTFLTLSTALLFITSYYLMYPTAIFFFLYTFFTISYHDQSISFKKWFHAILPMCLSIAVGVLLAAILLVPAVYFILQNERIGSFSFYAFYEPIQYLSILLSWLGGPFTQQTGETYLFNNGTENGYLYWFSLYSGVITAPVLLSHFSKRKKTAKEKSIRIILVILLVSMCVPCITSFWHGLSEPSYRWTILVILLQLILVADTFENMDYQQIQKGAWIYGCTACTALILCLVLDKTIAEYWKQYLYLLCCLMLLGLYVYLLKKKKTSLVLSLMMAESFLAACFFMTGINSSTYTYEESVHKDYIQYMEDTDSDLFYRIYINPKELMPVSSLNLNRSMILDYSSTTAYDTTYEPSLQQFNHMNGIADHIININRIDVLRMLGVKYYYVLSEEDLPAGESFTYVQDVDAYHVYKLNDYRPVGFTYTTFTTEEPSSDDPYDWDLTLLVSNELMNELEDVDSQSAPVNFNLLEHPDDNTFYGSITLKEKQVLYFSIPYSEGWNVYDDSGEKLDTYSVQGGFLGLVLDAGEYYLTLSFVPPGLKIGAIGTGFGLIGLTFIIVLDIKRKKNSLLFSDEQPFHNNLL